MEVLIEHEGRVLRLTERTEQDEDEPGRMPELEVADASEEST